MKFEDLSSGSLFRFGDEPFIYLKTEQNNAVTLGTGQMVYYDILLQIENEVTEVQINIL